MRLGRSAVGNLTFLMSFLFIFTCSSDLDLDGPPEAKRPRGDDGGEEDVEFSMASLARGAVTKVKGPLPSRKDGRSK